MTLLDSLNDVFLALSEKGQDGRCTDFLCVWLLAAREGQPLSEALQLLRTLRPDRALQPPL